MLDMSCAPLPTSHVEIPACEKVLHLAHDLQVAYNKYQSGRLTYSEFNNNVIDLRSQVNELREDQLKRVCRLMENMLKYDMIENRIYEEIVKKHRL